MLFSAAVQASIISLFSSTGTDPLCLFDTSSDTALQSDSFLHLLHDTLSLPAPSKPKNLLELPSIADRNHQVDGDDEDRPNLIRKGRELDQTVLHIQSPTLQTTYIHCPPTPKKAPSDLGADANLDVLGIKHPWVHLQVRDLGRDWAFEVGLVDHAGRTGIVRFSTFQMNVRSLPISSKSWIICSLNAQKRPRLITDRKTPSSAPLLLLPLSFPARSAEMLTLWSTITVNLQSLIPYFSSPLLRSDQGRNVDVDGGASDDASPHPSVSARGIPSGSYAYTSFVRVYATCRLRRIWFSESGPHQKVPWEFELYSD